MAMFLYEMDNTPIKCHQSMFECVYWNGTRSKFCGPLLICRMFCVAHRPEHCHQCVHPKWATKEETTTILGARRRHNWCANGWHPSDRWRRLSVHQSRRSSICPARVYGEKKCLSLSYSIVFFSSLYTEGYMGTVGCSGSGMSLVLSCRCRPKCECLYRDACAHKAEREWHSVQVCVCSRVVLKQKAIIHPWNKATIRDYTVELARATLPIVPIRRRRRRHSRLSVIIEARRQYIHYCHAYIRKVCCFECLATPSHVCHLRDVIGDDDDDDQTSQTSTIFTLFRIVYPLSCLCVVQYCTVLSLSPETLPVSFPSSVSLSPSHIQTHRFYVVLSLWQDTFLRQEA